VSRSRQVVGGTRIIITGDRDTTLERNGGHIIVVRGLMLMHVVCL
jgi:hypothetical protein